MCARGTVSIGDWLHTSHCIMQEFVHNYGYIATYFFLVLHRHSTNFIMGLETDNRSL